MEELTNTEKKTYNFIKKVGEIQTNNISDKHMIGAISKLKNLGLVEVFKKYGLLGKEFFHLYIIIPVCVLYLIRELIRFKRISNLININSNRIASLEILFQAMLIVFAVVAVIAIPFLWYGVILETIKNAIHAKY